MNLPAQVRNSLHNNGFTQNAIDVQLRGQNYKANAGEQVKFCGWDSIYIMADELTDILIAIIESEKILRESHIPLVT